MKFNNFTRFSSFLATIAIILTAISAARAQKVCYESKKEVPNNSVIFAESFSARKCMRVEGLGIKPDSNVVLDECLYRTNMAKDQKLQISTNGIGKTMIKTDGGRGQVYCLVTLQSDTLQNTLCNSNNLLQNWTLKPVKGQTGQFLIEQFSSKKCLKPKSLSRGSQIQLTSCNSYETEQIWKLYYSPPSNATAITPLLSC